jgi:hypothetical protein
MAEPLTLAALLEQLAKHGLRATRVDLFASGVVASFTAEPASMTAPPVRAEENQSNDPDALERFLNRKEPRA